MLYAESRPLGCGCRVTPRVTLPEVFESLLSSCLFLFFISTSWIPIGNLYTTLLIERAEQCWNDFAGVAGTRARARASICCMPERIVAPLPFFSSFHVLNASWGAQSAWNCRVLYLQFPSLRGGALMVADVVFRCRALACKVQCGQGLKFYARRIFRDTKILRWNNNRIANKQIHFQIKTISRIIHSLFAIFYEQKKRKCDKITGQKQTHHRILNNSILCT